MARPKQGGGDRGNALEQFSRYVLGIGYERNVGGTERALRYAGGTVSLLLGLWILAAPLLASTAANTLLALLLVGTGAYLIYEARVQYCPLNETIGRSTYRG